MPLQSPSIRRFVRRALVDTTGVVKPDRMQLASAFDTLCHRLQDRLKPMFGTTAVGALFVRSLQVARTEHPWLGELVPNGQDVCSPERMATVEDLDLNTLHDGLASVLAHNIGLLNAFVGEDIVFPLVQQAWGVSGASSDKGDQ
jgi:hypothetical protein